MAYAIFFKVKDLFLLFGLHLQQVYGNKCEHTRAKIREIGRQPLSWILFLAYLYCWMRYSYQIDKMNSRMLKNMRSTLFTIYACNYTLYMYI